MRRVLLLILLISPFTKLCAQTESVITATKGTEFWLGFLQQENWSNSTGTKRLDVFISSNVNTTGILSIPAQGYTQTFTVTANQTTTVNVPNSIGEHVSTETTDNKGIIITTADTVSVFAINFQNYTADGSLVLPTGSLGTEYMVTGYEALQNSSFPLYSMALIVATEDGTQVQVTPSVPTLAGHAAGVPYIVNLNRGESYQIKGAAANDDLTGTKIEATNNNGNCRPFAVFSGNTCVNIPNGCTACDALFEQEFPVPLWGNKYLITPFSFATSYTYKVVAYQNGTQVNINGTAVATLAAGQEYEANNVTNPVYVVTSKPASVTQFMQGITCSGAGDPSQLALNSEDQKLDNVTFSTVTSSVIDQHMVNVIMKAAYISQLTLDGVQVTSSQFTSFAPNPVYSYAQLNLSQGSHTLDADSGFTAYAYGTGSAESYAYALGSFSKIEVIPTDTILCTTSQTTLAPPVTLTSPQWTTFSDPNQVFSTSQSITIVPITSETYVVTGNIQPSGCSRTYQFTVEIPSPPQLVITQSADSICKYDQVQLNVDVQPPSGIYQYEWTPTIGISDPNIPDPIITPPQSMWYYITVSTPSGCGTTTDSIYINVRDGDVSKLDVLASETQYCVGGSSQLDLNIEKVIMQDDFDPAINTSFWSNISLGYNSGACGAVSGSALYFNGTGTRSAATSNLDVSSGGTIYFSLKIANSTAPCDNADPGEDIVLEYSTNNGASYTLINTYLENQYPNFVTLSIGIPTGAKTASTRFRWRQVSNSGNNQDNWALDNVYISTVSSSGFSFLWTPSLGLNADTITNPAANPANTTNYVINVTANSTGCIYKDSVLIDVGQHFSLSVPPTDTVCQISGKQLYAAPNLSGNYLYNWSPASSLSSSTIQNPIATPTSTTTYQVIVNSLQGCSDTASVLIRVPAIAGFYVIPPTDSICTGQSIQLNTVYEKACGTSGGSCTSLSNTQIGASSNTTASNNATIYNGSSTSARFQILYTKAELNAAGLTQASTITQLGFKITAIAGGNIYDNFTIKMGCTSLNALSSNYVPNLGTVFNPKTITISNSINYYTFDNNYDWDGNSNVLVEICYDNTSPSANSSINISPVGYNTFIGTSGNAVCNATSGTPSTSKPNTYFKYCNASAVTSLSYQWSPSTSLDFSNIANPVANPVSSITYQLIATDASTGCRYKDSIKINVGSIFGLTTTDSVINCSNSGIHINTVPDVADSYTYQWTPSADLNNANISNPIASPSVSTEYIVQVTSSSGCTVYDTAYVSVNLGSLYTFSVTPSSDTICSGESIQLNTLFQKGCGRNGSLCNGAPVNAVLGTSSTTSNASNITVYKGSANSAKMQFLYKASELNAAGMSSSKTISALSFNVAGISGSSIYQNFTIKMSCTGANSISSAFDNSTLTVFTPKNVTIINGTNNYFFDNSYDWDGTSNLIVEICYSNPGTSSNSTITYSTTSFNSSLYLTGATGVCNATFGAVGTNRPNTTFKYCTSSGSALDVLWSPSIGLDNDTIPNPIANPAATTTYTLIATDPASGCIMTDSAVIYNVNPNLSVLGNDTNICEGQTLNIQAASGFNSYTWNDGSTQPVKTINAAGTYWIEVDGTCGQRRDTIVVTSAGHSPYISLGNDTAICTGSGIVINVDHDIPYTYQWQDGSTDSIFSTTAAGIYWVESRNYCGITRDSIEITTYTAPPVNLGNDTTLCTGASFTMTAQSGYTSYQWQNGNTTSTFTVTNAGQYYITAGNACTTSSDTINISYIDIEEVDLGNDTSICNGQSVTLIPAQAPFLSYLWQDGTTDTVYTTSTGGIFWLESQSICGSSRDTIQVNILSTSPVNLGNDTSICNGNTLILNAGAGYTSYNWQNGSAISYTSASSTGQYYVSVSNICISSSDTINIQFNGTVDFDLGNDTVLCNNSTMFINAYQPPIVSYQWQNNSNDSVYYINASGTYTLTATTTCGIITDSIHVISSPPKNLFIGNDTSVCNNTSITLNAGSGYTTYLWQDNSTNQTNNTNTNNIYWVQATDICGTYSDTIRITHIAAPYIDLYNDTSMCENQSVVLHAGTNTDVYFWNDGTTADSLVANAPGEYILIGYNQCGLTSDTVLVSIKPPPNINLGNDLNLCIGAQHTLNAYDPDYISYLWQNGSSASSYVITSAGTYWLTVANICGTNSDTITAGYFPAPFVTIGSDTTLCPGAALSLNASSATGTILWQDGSSNNIFNVNGPGIYWAEAFSQCGSYRDSAIITYLNNPSVNLGNDTSFCTGGSAHFQAMASNATSLVWQDGSVGNQFNTSQQGTYWLTASNACGSSTDTVRVLNIYPNPNVNLGPDTLLCGGISKQINLNFSGASYLWQDNSTSNNYNITQAGTYSVIVTDIHNCKGRDSLNVSTGEYPKIFIGNDTSMCVYDLIELKSGAPEENDYTLTWFDGTHEPTISVGQKGDYYLMAENTCGVVYDSINIATKDCECNADVPTAFSPNDDGVNDILYVRGNCIQDLTFTIYNRWGQKVFETNDLNKGWDGTVNGVKSNSAVFMYHLGASTIYNNTIINKKGNISLIR